MEFVVQILFVLALLSSLLQISQWKILPQLILSVSLAIVSYMLTPWLVEQSKAQLLQWLGDSVIAQNLAAVQMFEAILFVGIDMANLKQVFGHTSKRWEICAGFYPGVIVPAAILYFQMICFYAFSHLLNFELLGASYSVGIVVVFMLMSQIIRKLVPERHLRMEIRNIIIFAQILACIIITIFCQKLPYQPQSTQFEMMPLLFIAGITLTLFVCGWLWSKYKIKLKLKWTY